MVIRVPIHDANTGQRPLDANPIAASVGSTHRLKEQRAVTPYNAGNIGPDPTWGFRTNGYFLPCDCFDLCPYLDANGGEIVGLKFEIGIVPSKSKALNFWWEKLSTCEGVQVAITYEDILGAEIEAITPAAALTFDDDWTTIDTSNMFNFNVAGETGYIGRSDVGIFCIEILADPNGALTADCCPGKGTCLQPMLQWSFEYQTPKLLRNAWEVCNNNKLGGRNLEAVDCPPDDIIAAWEASVRYSELATAFTL